jgi:hypothetical protein
MAGRSRSAVLPIVALLLVALVVGDVARRALRPAGPGSAGNPPAARPSPAGRAPAPGGTVAGSSAMAAAVADSGRPDPAARAATLLRIDREGADTYLPAMLKEEDSTLHRWGDDRGQRPLRVAVVREPVRGFLETYVANVAWAVTRWNTVGLPVYLQEVADTTGADIVVRWADRLDSNRAGRADVAWRHQGPITHVRITLGTHTPDGRQVLPSQMVALALHELGHALGLGHSPVAADALHPETSALDLTARDRRTAVLLYSIPPGSLK